ncbi:MULTISPECIES: isoprenyl transferase [Caproicibacterium]|jgi:undecaprenyl diphosphate synthase|uniref:Isoprenyl transferase n=1 Tax=Caproicibacterium lactatifermentans TaxID=2666138 RepID=A0A859DPD0_9FIRM|nr:isoprenyl transferase [Caproicibacterium lactatifermentans]ARP50360.1 di-trans,poly-cis-decaprenylcistransferase [Ruminococcaceae bacterium CPB6]QKN23917.1 isoprenyl transferase [Caproicibacterium lactatifermentans]QKO31012.1 isoprenyl transferase [Caproicibacterium lactatifermentans]
MKKTTQKAALSPELLPRHLGIIMDGNGRWAKKRGLPRSIGHKVGAAVFKKIARYCSNIGIPYLTVYAFSTENWTRPPEEVGALMALFKQYLQVSLRDFRDDDIKVNFIGDMTRFAPTLQRLIFETADVCKDRKGMVLNIAMNYGGRAELVRAARSMAAKAAAGTLRPEEITEDTISQELYTAGQPDPDLILRPSGEHRLSNFLLWQSAYTEFLSMNVLWPDFTTDDLDNALNEYAHRSRRFGGI